MGLTTRGTARRWLAVAAGVALLASTPTLVQAVGDRGARAGTTTAADAQSLVGRILGTADLPHTGLAESRGTLGLPDLPRLGDVAGVLGSTTRTRVFWGGGASWRVDRLLLAGEEDDYAVGGDLVSWDYERNRLRTVVGVDADAVRLPRPADLLPPPLARRILGGLGASDTVRPLPARRIAGRTAAGLRVVPDAARSTVGHVDVWVDDATALPLEVVVADRGGRTALSARYLEVRLDPPRPSDLVPPAGSGAQLEMGYATDLADAVDQAVLFDLPRRLAGLPATTPLADVRGSESYGDGLARFVLLPLGSNGGSALRSALAGGARELEVRGGRAALLTTSALTLVVARGDRPGNGFLLAGLVTGETLEEAVAEIFADPPRQP